MSEVEGEAPNLPASDTPMKEQVVPDVDTNCLAYLDRDHFTSEKFKIVIRNLPKYYGVNELKKLLNKKLNLSAHKIKPPSPYSDFAYVCFKSDEARDEGVRVLNGYKWKGKELRAQLEEAMPDPLVVVRAAVNQDSRCRPDLLKDGRTMVEKLKDSVVPLWRNSYDEQLDIKTNAALKLLKRLTREMSKESGSIAVTRWLNQQKKKYDGLPCELLPIRHSPTVDGYRNKCEFTIGFNEETGEKTVGFRISSYAGGSLCVVSAADMPHVPQKLQTACSVAEAFIRESSLDVYNQETHEGYWISLTARYGFRTDQLMLMFTLRPQQLTPEQIQEIADQMKAFFSFEKARGISVHSLLLAPVERGSRQPLNLILVNGESHIYDEICGYKFRISPTSFFQTNTAAAEVLYNQIRDLSGLTTDSALIDVCCGAGTIGICLAKHAGEVLGLEKYEEAVRDAKQNARDNNVTTAEFFTGAAEDVLSAVVRRATKPRIVAVVDPPRAGLEKSAVSQLRGIPKLEEFVYASCNPALAMKNFVDFSRCTSKRYPGDPFVPVRCVPVDMFPHTEGYELVIYFQRITKAVECASNEAADEDAVGQAATES